MTSLPVWKLTFREMTGSGGGPPVGPLTQDFPDKDKGGLLAHPLPSKSPGQGLIALFLHEAVYGPRL